VCVCVCVCVFARARAHTHITDHRITAHLVANPTKPKQEHSEVVLHDWANVRRVYYREGRAVSCVFRALFYGRNAWSCVAQVTTCRCVDPDSAVGVMSPLQRGQWQNVCQFASRAHLACYSLGGGDSFFPTVKVHSPSSWAEVQNEWNVRPLRPSL